MLSISLSASGLEGRLKPIGKLTAMAKFDVSHNKLYGSIPRSFSSMQRLQHLYLNNNQLTGLFDNCPSRVEILSQSNNRVVGEISRKINDMYYLRSLNLSQNNFVGNLPDTYLYNLQYLNLNSNSLTGTIPSSLRRLGDINMLSNTLPCE